MWINSPPKIAADISRMGAPRCWMGDTITSVNFCACDRSAQTSILSLWPQGSARRCPRWGGGLFVQNTIIRFCLAFLCRTLSFFLVHYFLLYLLKENANPEQKANLLKTAHFHVFTFKCFSVEVQQVLMTQMNLNTPILYADPVTCVQTYDKHDGVMYLYIVFPVFCSIQSTTEERRIVLLSPPCDKEREAKV